MNLFVESLTKTREAYTQYANKMAWIFKFLDSLTITGTNVDAGSVRETLKMHVIYFIQGVETFEDFKQWVSPLGVGNLLNDKWWEEQTKSLDVFDDGWIMENAKPINYQSCADALLKMWMDKILSDGEYYKIMDRLNKAHTDGKI